MLARLPRWTINVPYSNRCLDYTPQTKRRVQIPSYSQQRSKSPFTLLPLDLIQPDIYLPLSHRPTLFPKTPPLEPTFFLLSHIPPFYFTMADQLKEIADIPRDFLRDGTQFVNRCTKRTLSPFLEQDLPDPTPYPRFECQKKKRFQDTNNLSFSIADKREFIKISQAVGMGFVIMGVIGYVVKLSTPLRVLA